MQKNKQSLIGGASTTESGENDAGLCDKDETEDDGASKRDVIDEDAEAPVASEEVVDELLGDGPGDVDLEDLDDMADDLDFDDLGDMAEDLNEADEDVDPSFIDDIL